MLDSKNPRQELPVSDDEAEQDADDRGTRATASKAVLTVADVLHEETRDEPDNQEYSRPGRREDRPGERHDYTAVLLRFAEGAHDLVDVVGDTVEDFNSTRANELIHKGRARAHQAVDMFTKLAFVAPRVIEELIYDYKNKRDR